MSMDAAVVAAILSALRSEEGQHAIENVVRRIIREEIARANAGPNALVDVEGAARLLDMSPAAVRKAAARGRIRCKRLGRLLRFDPKELFPKEGGR